MNHIPYYGPYLFPAALVKVPSVGVAQVTETAEPKDSVSVTMMVLDSLGNIPSFHVFLQPTHFRHSVGSLCDTGRWDYYYGEWSFEGHNRPNGSFDVSAFASSKQVSHNVGPSRKVQNLIRLFTVLTARNYVMTPGKPFLMVASGTSLHCLMMCLCIGMPGM